MSNYFYVLCQTFSFNILHNSVLSWLDALVSKNSQSQHLGKSEQQNVNHEYSYMRIYQNVFIIGLNIISVFQKCSSNSNNLFKYVGHLKDVSLMSNHLHDFKLFTLPNSLVIL